MAAHLVAGLPKICRFRSPSAWVDTPIRYVLGEANKKSAQPICTHTGGILEHLESATVSQSSFYQQDPAESPERRIMWVEHMTFWTPLIQTKFCYWNQMLYH